MSAVERWGVWLTRPDGASYWYWVHGGEAWRGPWIAASEEHARDRAELLSLKSPSWKYEARRVEYDANGKAVEERGT